MSNSNPQPVARWVNRDAFTKARYERFLAKQKFLKTGNKRLAAMIHMTNLDGPFRPGDPNSKLLRDVVICDHCNEDILDVKFVMLEDQLCFHAACTDLSPRYPKNVIPLVQPFPSHATPPVEPTVPAEE